MFDLMTIKELADELQTSENTIRSWMRTGELPSELFKKIGGRVFVRANKVREWLDKNG